MTGADIYMKTCKEKALEWNVSPRSVNDMCKKGRIQGAIKEKGSWLIPDDSPKPMDGRVSNGKYIKKNMVAKAEVKSLPIGISDYVRAQEEYYYVDKTLLIKEFLDKKPLVSLFTRPRRFGKTLNMDMLRVFFEISDKNTSKYFADKNIWQCGEEYRSHQGKYPVIFLTFKDVKFDTWDATIDKIRGLLQEEYQYKIKSNRESGDGRFDVSLIPREKRYPGIILELKWKEKLSDVELEKWSNEALKQIGELRYDSEMKEDGITEILKFGIAFSGKKVCVRTE